MKIRLCLPAMLLIACQCLAGNPSVDTLKLSIRESENLFLQNNLPILAAKYNVDANKALVRQAKLWDNPVLTTDQNIYDGNGGFLKHDKTNGQVYVQLMQVVRTAGKRNKLAQLAEDNTAISTAQFDDLVRTLRYTLRSDLYEINHQLQIKELYSTEIDELTTLVAGMDEELIMGNISVKDNLRIKALLFSLQNDLISADAQLIPLEEEVRLLLGNKDSSFIRPVLSYSLADLVNTRMPPADELLQIAYSSRPDLRVASQQLNYANHNLYYQKALAKPDISIGTEYDQHSSYAPNYVGLAISLPLNIFNKNQGNIASAQFNIKQQEVLLQAQTSKVASDIFSALGKVKLYRQVINTKQFEFTRQYDALFRNMLSSYQHRQVSLLEFIDFADAYKATKLQVLQQQSEFIKAIADLNYEAGKDIISIK